MQNTEERLARMNTQLEKWGTRLDELMADTKAGFVEARTAYHKRTDDLKAEHREARLELDQLRAEVDEAGAEGKDSDGESMADLKAKHHAARARLDELLAAGGAKWEGLEVEHASVWDEPEADAGRHEKSIANIEAQLEAWSSQLDHLVAGYLKAGAQSHDAYRVRIDHLRDRYEAVQAKLTEHKLPTGNGAPPWGTFRAAIEDDWTALENGFEDLTR